MTNPGPTSLGRRAFLKGGSLVLAAWLTENSRPVRGRVSLMIGAEVETPWASRQAGDCRSGPRPSGGRPGLVKRSAAGYTPTY
jgi:hypothetical protein